MNSRRTTTSRNHGSFSSDMAIRSLSLFTEVGIVKKKIPGFEGYFADAEGRIWSQWKQVAQPGKSSGFKTVLGGDTELAKLSEGINSEGYPTVHVRKTVAVHTLVLLAFSGPRPRGMEARHYPDPTKTNCRPDNLQWATRLVNQRDRIEHGTSSRGENSGRAKLSSSQVTEIRDLSSSMSQAAIARKFGVSRSAVCHILAGRNWRYE